MSFVNATAGAGCDGYQTSMNESGHGILASAYRQAGRRADALRALTIAEGIEADPYWAKFIGEERAILDQSR